MTRCDQRRVADFVGEAAGGVMHGSTLEKVKSRLAGGSTKGTTGGETGGERRASLSESDSEGGIAEGEGISPAYYNLPFSDGTNCESSSNSVESYSRRWATKLSST